MLQRTVLRRVLTPGITLVLVALALVSPAAADLGVRDGEQQVSGGVLWLGKDSTGCCAEGPCHGNFVLENTGEETLGRVEFEAFALASAGGQIPAGELSFAPASLPRLGVQSRKTITVKLASVERFAPGSYRGEIEIRAESLDPYSQEPERLSLPVEVVICGAPSVASLRLVPGRGDLRRGVLGFVPGPDGCAGVEHAARFTVEADGDVPLLAVTPSLADLPRDVEVVFEPAAAALEPGSRQVFRARLRAPDSVPAGTWTGALLVRDPETGAADSALARFERCAVSTGGGDPAPDPSEPGGQSGQADPTPGDDPLEGSGQTGGDPYAGSAGLALELEASRSSVRPGQVLTWSCRVANAGTAPARDLVLEVELPAGFRYVSGRTALDGDVGPEPESRHPYRWSVGRLEAGAEARLAFQAVAEAVDLGTAVASARVRSERASAGPVECSVEVTRRWGLAFGMVEGRVHYGDGRGVPGVRLLLDSARETLSAPDGSFAFVGLEEGEHLVSLDPRSLAPGEHPTGEDSRFVNLFSGSSEEVMFEVLGLPVVTLSVSRIPDSGEVRPHAD